MTGADESVVDRPAGLSRWKRLGLWLLATFLVSTFAVALWTVVDEVRTSRYQATRLAALDRKLQYAVRAGPSDAIRYPGNGPYDQRLGYHALPRFLDRLQTQGWQITDQARISPELQDVMDRGLFAPYAEKNQAGLALLDCRAEPLHVARLPQRAYGRFDAIPPLVVDTLLFIEDRDLLDDGRPRMNPAINWSRLLRAVADQAWSWIDPEHQTPGGSTLATQIEKYRHSSGGRTASARDKLHQIASASLRAYIDGENTLPRRRQLVVDYLDTVPLAARPGIGEIHGLGDALAAWYGRGFDEVNGLLIADAGDTAAQSGLLGRQALAFKQVLSLLLAQRRPSYYLGRPDVETGLGELANAHLRVLAESGLISPALRDAALPLALNLQTGAPPRDELLASVPFSERKAATALRSRLGGLLGVTRSYELDRIDAQVDSSIDGQAQRAGVALLGSLSQREGARAAGLYGPYLLNERDDPSHLVFSFTLFERGEQVNRLRVQTDNLNQPFDINEGARLDLGSTAKLRTLVTYLSLVAEMHARWADLAATELAATDIDARDALGLWARQYLQHASDRALQPMLDAAMLRSYSANPAEGFFTGGGLHHFGNFEAADNNRVLTVHEATTRSVNLVYIRLMRDLVRHLMFEEEGSAAALRADRDDPVRQALLARFADKEGREYLARFFREMQGLTPDELVAQLLKGHNLSHARLASVFGALYPKGDAIALAAFVLRYQPDTSLAGGELAQLFARYGGGQMSLADRGYVAGVHPLALWLTGHRLGAPDASLSDAIAASAAERQQVYGWLFRSRNRDGQDRRIRTLLEIDAFARIQQRWQRLGYPFEVLTPSYASALGASGDRPSALAELMGIIVNGGLRKPVARLESLVFARDTPYETRLAYRPQKVERVLDAAVAATARETLIGVVQEGTGRRLKDAFVRDDGSPVAVGAKTGTGDHRYYTYDKGGAQVTSRVVSRSATLMFLLGERYYGTLMVFVNEPYAADYRFTSALPSQLLKAMAPSLESLLDGTACR
ncbi:MAG: transglycosylase domain-containing protein [Betaproteobacteria bacterium]